MRKLVIVFIFICMTMYSYGQSIYIGKLIGKGTPQITSDPIVPCHIFWLETSSTHYVLSINSRYTICNTPLTVDGIEYLKDDEVEITGTVSTHLDFYSKEYFKLEVETIKMLTTK